MARKKTTTKAKKPNLVKLLTTKKTPKTRVAIIIDASSSMAHLREQVVSGFNQQVKTLRENSKDQDVKVSLVTFSSTVDEPRIWNKSIESLRSLETNDYFPHGNTALYDAVGTTLDKLNKLEEASDPETAFLVTIMTDGEENYSRTYNGKTLASLITALQNTGRWTFSYMGANQDLSKVSATLHIPIQNTMIFTASQAGANAAWGMNNAAQASYMVSRSAGNMGSSAMYSSNGMSADANQPGAQATTQTPNNNQTVPEEKKKKSA